MLKKFFFDRLIKHLEKVMDDKNSKCLIFTGTKRTADDITRVRYNLPYLLDFNADQRVNSSSVKMDGLAWLFMVTNNRTSAIGY